MATVRSGASADEWKIDPTSLAGRVTLYDTTGAALSTYGTNSAPQPVVSKPLPYGSLGHYRVMHRALLANTQAANARLFEIRNTSTNLIVCTKMVVQLYQFAAGTAQAMGLDAFRITSFTAVDTTNTVTLNGNLKRTTGMGAAPGNAAIRGVTVAGAAAGMTGGTLTSKSAEPFWGVTFGITAAIGSTNAHQYGPYDVFDDNNGTHPYVFAQNEGFEIENRILNVTTYGIELTVMLEYAEVSAF